MTDATEAIASLRWARTYNTECHIRPRQLVELLAHIDEQAAAIATLELHVETLEVTVTEELITARGQADCIEELKHDLREYMSIANEQAAEIDRLRDRMPMHARLFEAAPCYLCGYNGPGYYQPQTHPCAARYHATLDGEE